MKFTINRVNLNNHKAPSKRAVFKGFDDDNSKKYEIEINSIKQLIDVIKENNTDISIFPPVSKDNLYNIEINDY